MSGQHQNNISAYRKPLQVPQSPLFLYFVQYLWCDLTIYSVSGTMDDHIGPWRTDAQGHLTVDKNGDAKTDYARWRLLDDRGRQTWHYLESDEDNQKWPQSVAEKYFLGLPMVLLYRGPTYLKTHTDSPSRAFRTCQPQSLHHRRQRTVWNFSPNCSCPRETGLASMVGQCSCCRVSSSPIM